MHRPNGKNSPVAISYRLNSQKSYGEGSPRRWALAELKGRASLGMFHPFSFLKDAPFLSHESRAAKERKISEAALGTKVSVYGNQKPPSRAVGRADKRRRESYRKQNTPVGLP